MAAEKRSTKQRPASARTRGTAAAQRRSRTSAARRTTGGAGATVAVPVVTPKVKVIKVHVPTRGMSYVGDAGRLAVSYLPSADRLAFYGGLGLAAVVGLLDWPVAAAIGLGTMIARRTFGDRRRGAGRPVVTQTAAGAKVEAAAERMAEAAAPGTTGRSRAGGTSRSRSTSRTGGTTRTGGTSGASRSKGASRTTAASKSSGAAGSASGSRTTTGGSRTGTSGSRGTASRSRSAGSATAGRTGTTTSG